MNDKEKKEILELLKDLAIDRALKFLEEEKIAEDESEPAFIGYYSGFREGILFAANEYDLVKKPTDDN